MLYELHTSSVSRWIRYSEAYALGACRWYVSRINRQDAEYMLLEKNEQGQSQRDGAFLVRPSESTPGEFSLSVKSVLSSFYL